LKLRFAVAGRALVAVLALVAVPGQAATLGGPLPGPLPLFPADNWWNLDVSTAPVDAALTSQYINSFIGSSTPLHADFGREITLGSVGIYGFPYVVVNASQPKKVVQFQYDDQSDGVGQAFYPIPDEAITEPHWIEGGPPGNATVGGDRHMLIVDADNKYLYELYALRWQNGQWFAGSGAFFDLRNNHRRPETWTSADAAGLAILPGLVRYDEAYGASEIGHAFRMTVHDSLAYVYPASHDAGSLAGAPPLGTRFRLKAGKDLSGFPPAAQRVFRAMKKYGLIVADNGSDMYVSGTWDNQWPDEMIDAFRQLRADDFEVLPLGFTGPANDLSGDGQADLVWRHQPSGSLYAWLVRGNTQIAGTPLTPGGVADLQWRVEGVADLNGDAKPDLLWRHQTTGALYAWFMNGTTQTGGAWTIPAAVSDTQWKIEGVADLNGDTKPDLVWRHQTTGALYVWFMDGVRQIGGAYASPSGVDLSWRIEGIRDLNADGKPDFVWRQTTTGSLYVWLMDGVQQAVGRYVTPSRVADTQWAIEEVADRNGDGKPDFLWRHQTTGSLYVWFMNGTTQTGGAYLTPASVTDVGWKIVSH